MRDSDIMKTYCRHCGGMMQTTDKKCGYCLRSSETGTDQQSQMGQRETKDTFSYGEMERSSKFWFYGDGTVTHLHP